MQLNVLTPGGTQATQTVDVADGAFARDFNEALIHQVVTAHLAGARAGTRAQKNRSEVRGGGIKPWRQKGTGRARAGSIRSPIWRSGGVTFAAKPQDHSQKVNKKMYRAAVSSIFSELIRQERLQVVDDFKVETPKTKALLAQLADMNISDVLIVTEKLEGDLTLATRNVHKVKTMAVANIDPVSLIAHKNVLITVPALKALEARLA